MHDLVGCLLIQAADVLPDLAAASERHRAQAEFGHEHTRVGELSIFHPSSLSHGLRRERLLQHWLEDSRELFVRRGSQVQPVVHEELEP